MFFFIYSCIGLTVVLVHFSVCGKTYGDTNGKRTDEIFNVNNILLILINNIILR